MTNAPVQMHRASDGANALVEAAEVDLWRGYGFKPAGEKAEVPADPVVESIEVDEPKSKRKAKATAAVVG